MAKIALLLTEGFADWEYALLAGTGGPFFGLDIQFFAPAAGTVTSQGGLGAAVLLAFEALPDWRPEAIVVVGGMIWETDAAPDISGMLTTHHENGGLVAGICGGTLALARAGLLNAVRHTSNDAEFLAKNASGYAGSNFYQAGPRAVSDNRVITAPGTAPVSFTAAIFEQVGVDDDAVQQFRVMMAAEHA